MDNLIYLDHQASTPLAPGVFDKMREFFERNSANPHSSHLMGMQCQQAIEDARYSIADLLNVDCTEIYFTSGATEANNLAIKGVLQSDRNSGLLTCSTEHKCILAAARHASDHGHCVIYTEVGTEGYIDLRDFEHKLLEYKPKLVSIMFANNEIGTIQDIQEISKLCQKYGVLLHSDMAQAITHSNISLKEIGVDFASFSAHKLNGPKGVGAIYISHEAKSRIAPIIHGGGQETGIRSGTLPTPQCVGFGAAAEHWKRNGKKIRAQMKSSRDKLWENLIKTVPGIRLIGPAIEKRHVANLNVHVPGIDAEVLLGILSSEIAASTGSACTSGIAEPSHVIKAIDPDAALDGTIRLSVGPELNTDTVIRAAQVIGDAVRQNFS